MNSSDEVEDNQQDNILSVNNIINESDEYSEDSPTNLNNNIFHTTISSNINNNSEDSNDDEQTTDYNNENNLNINLNTTNFTISNNNFIVTDINMNSIPTENLNSISPENITSIINNSANLPNLSISYPTNIIDMSSNVAENEGEAISQFLNYNYTQNSTNTISSNFNFNNPPTTPPDSPPGINNAYSDMPPLISGSTLSNPQYSMLNNNDDDNPFSKCKINKLEYDTDNEETNDLRIIFTWNYEFNYEYFSLNGTYIFSNKNDLFNSQLNELKKIRNSNINNNSTGKIFKLPNNGTFLKDMIVDLYLIAYYDNVKADIEFYGIFNQELEESKLIDNIKREGIYGTKGVIDQNNSTNLGENDFIVIHRKLSII